MVAKLFAVRPGADGIGSYAIQPGLNETPMTAAVKYLYDRRIREGLTVAPRTGRAVHADGGLAILGF
jgi:NAD(P)-dependent dehydrogenase (short-subunit alcohol dehydrogenase family)